MPINGLTELSHLLANVVTLLVIDLDILLHVLLYEHNCRPVSAAYLVPQWLLKQCTK